MSAPASAAAAQRARLQNFSSAGAPAKLDAQQLRALLADGGELALIDVREELIFSQNHPLLARSVPLSRFELKFAGLVPRHAHRAVR